MTRFDRQFSAAARQYDNAAPEDDTRAERRDVIRQELEQAWLASPDRLYTDAEEVLGFSDYTDHVSRDLAAALQGHPDDQDKRDLAFMRELRAKIEQCIRDDAKQEADTQEEREIQSFNEGRDDHRS